MRLAPKRLVCRERVWLTRGYAGINPASDGVAFAADNGIIPDGSHVAFVQAYHGATASICQTIPVSNPAGNMSFVSGPIRVPTSCRRRH